MKLSIESKNQECTNIMIDIASAQKCKFSISTSEDGQEFAFFPKRISSLIAIAQALTNFGIKH